MDENTWRLLQTMMWGFGIQTTVLLALFGGMWHLISKRFESIDKRFDRLEERLTRLENDMIEVKTILRMKECCMIKDDSQMKKTG